MSSTIASPAPSQRTVRATRPAGEFSTSTIRTLSAAREVRPAEQTVEISSAEQADADLRSDTGIGLNSAAKLCGRSREMWHTKTSVRVPSPRNAMTAATTWAHEGESGRQRIRDEIAKLTGSTIFYRSGRLCQFLRFIVEHWLQDPSETLKEYRIGTEVYGRPPSFDPRFDPIVRVEARRLRTKLDQYYDTEGLSDPIEILLPVGAYVPLVRKRATMAHEAGSIQNACDNHQRERYVEVQPFIILDPDEKATDFGRGLCEEILDALYADGVPVRVAESNRADGTFPASDLTESPFIRAQLEGSIRRYDENIRVSARLLDKRDRRLLWSRTFPMQLSNMFAAQRLIASAIASCVREISPEQDSARPVEKTFSCT